MKTFIFKVTISKNNKECNIYKMVNNKPIYIDTIYYPYGANMGAISEVNRFLIDNKYIPKSWCVVNDEPSYYYHGRNNKYRIYEV